MEGIFRFDSRLYRTVEKLVNLVKLNFLWILFKSSGCDRGSCQLCPP